MEIRRRAWPWATLVLVLALGRLWWLPAHAPLNVNEGWNAGHVARAFGLGPLYPAPDALTANNYPPLSFFVIGLVGRLVGDAILAGRLVSLLSEVATGAAVYVAVARLTHDRGWASAGALLFAGIAMTLLRPYLAMNDPQWLAQALMAWALVLVIPARLGERLSARQVIAAAALVVTGGLVKHNLVAIPAAVTLWLWAVDRRALSIWLVTGVVLGGAACAVLFAIWGPDIFIQVLAPARSYSVARMAAKAGPLLLFVLPGLLAAWPLLRTWRDDSRLLLPVLMLAIALPTAIIQRSGDGVDINAVFETVIGLAIAVPAACALRLVHPWRWLGIAALPAATLVPLAAFQDVREFTGRDAAVRRWQPFIARTAETKGPVACDDQAVCHWAGRQSAIDFFAMKQRLLKGDVPALRATLERGDLALIAMRSENPGWHENHLLPAIRTHYRTIYAAEGYELLERR